VKNKKQNKTTKRNMFLGCVILGIGIMMFASIIKTEYIPHRNPIDTQISQYSNKIITPNAIASNPEFQKITFDAVPQKKSYFFTNQIASVIKSIKTLGTNPTEPKQNTKEHGIWIWTPIMIMTPEYIESTLSQAQVNRVNTIYISIDTYLDVFVMPKGEKREQAKKAFSDKLENFIVSANSRGIAVDAEAGWQNWAEEGNTYKAFAIVNYVKNFNNTRANKFRGFQYDVEPYLLASYEKNKSVVLKNFIQLIDQTENFMQDSSLKFSIVIPDFYDKEDQMTPKIAYNGKKDYTFKHLLNILDRKPDSSIIIMSYRSFAEGYDGSIEISNNEMQTAKNGKYNTQVVIAQETGDVMPPYITFHRTSKNYLSGQISKINKAFNSNPNFGGIAIHYVNAFLALK
jgi:hypothetical protein